MEQLYRMQFVLRKNQNKRKEGNDFAKIESITQCMKRIKETEPSKIKLLWSNYLSIGQNDLFRPSLRIDVPCSLHLPILASSIPYRNPLP